MEQVLAADVLGSGETGDEACTYYVERALVPLRALAVEAVRSGGHLCHYYALHS
jgi:hypothetical protein